MDALSPTHLGKGQALMVSRFAGTMARGQETVDTQPHYVLKKRCRPELGTLADV
jgi:hypothetical protein